MEKFIRYLEKKRIGTSKQRTFFALWVRNLYRTAGKKPGDPLPPEQITHFLAELADTHHDWQVQQAQDAIWLYLYFQSQTANSTQDAKSPQGDRLWSDAAAQMVDAMRLKHLSMRTEQTYLGWLRQFYRFVKAVAPKELNSRHVTEFLTYLAVERKVAKATQNQAFNAVLFFFRHIIKQDISDLWEAVRSKRSQGPHCN